MLGKEHLQKSSIFIAGLLIGILIPTILLNSEIRDLNYEVVNMDSVIQSQNSTINSLREKVAIFETKIEDEAKPWWLFYGDITPRQALHMLEGADPPGIIDVRLESEYNESHIKNAVNIPINLLMERVYELNQSREYIVYCKSGYRSRQALIILTNIGVNKTYNIAGGIDNWSNAGLPLNSKCHECQ
jgi:adenylyltransferase/sulfurtransferase